MSIPCMTCTYPAHAPWASKDILIYFSYYRSSWWLLAIAIMNSGVPSQGRDLLNLLLLLIYGSLLAKLDQYPSSKFLKGSPSQALTEFEKTDHEFQSTVSCHEYGKNLPPRNRLIRNCSLTPDVHDTLL